MLVCLRLFYDCNESATTPMPQKHRLKRNSVFQIHQITLNDANATDMFKSHTRTLTLVSTKQRYKNKADTLYTITQYRMAIGLPHPNGQWQKHS